jgi:CIC family chloride channel protein
MRRTAVPAAAWSGAWTARAAAWLRAGRGGMFLLALLIGAGSGLGAAAFRYLISGFTWLATGHSEFGQQGHVASAHLPWLGLGFFVLIPASTLRWMTGRG